MSCSAKVPVYGFFISAFFPGRGGLVMVGLYLLGIVMGILAALVAKRTAFQGEAVPFVMELPNYRLPSVRNVAQLLWEKSRDFLQKAFSVILVATVAVWFLKSFDLRFNLVESSQQSLLAVVSGALVPLFRPLGLGDWRVCTSLISGFIAKESVVSTLTVLLGITGENMAPLVGAYSPIVALAFLVFSLLYTPCVAAIAAVRRELGGKWAGFMVVFQCAVAWIFAALVRGVGLLFGLA
jgi:ferrous iron transport protein B